MLQPYELHVFQLAQYRLFVGAKASCLDHALGYLGHGFMTCGCHVFYDMWLPCVLGHATM